MLPQKLRFAPAMQYASKVERLARSCAVWRCPNGHPEVITGLMRVAVISLVMGLGLSGCSGDRNLTRPHPEVTRAELLAAMTPAAGVTLGPDGKLELGAPPNTGRAQISGEMAGALSVAVARFCQMAGENTTATTNSVSATKPFEKCFRIRA